MIISCPDDHDVSWLQKKSPTSSKHYDSTLPLNNTIKHSRETLPVDI